MGPSIQLNDPRTVERSDILFCMCRSPSSSLLYCGSSDFSLYELDLPSGEPRRRMEGHRSFVSGVAATRDGQLVTSSWDRQLIWWDPNSASLVRRVLAHRKWIRTVVASPDGKLVASVADDMVCRLWHARSGNRFCELTGHAEQTPHHYPSMLFTCCFSTDGAYLATGDKIGHVVVWRVETGEAVATFESPEVYTWDPVQRRHSIGGIRSLCFSPDSRLLAVGGIGHIQNIDGLGGQALVQVYDWRTGERTHKFEHPEQKGIVEKLQFARGGRWLVAAGGAKTGLLLFMDMESEEFLHAEVAPMHIHGFEINDAADDITAVGHGMVAFWQSQGDQV